MRAVEELIDLKKTGVSEAVLLTTAIDFIRSKKAEGAKEAVKALKRRIASPDAHEQLRGLQVTEQLVNALDFVFHEQVGEEDFLNNLSRVMSRPDASLDVKRKILQLSADWSAKFADAVDLLPGFQLLYANLASNGHPMPQPANGHQLIDEFIQNEADGQDPEEFITEVHATLGLFDQIASAGPKDVSEVEAITSIATNLDRYAEQIELWMDRLEPGEWMSKAIELHDAVYSALNRFRELRVG